MKLRLTYEFVLANQRGLIDSIQSKLNIGVGDMKYWEKVLEYCYEIFPGELEMFISNCEKELASEIKEVIKGYRSRRKSI